MTSASEGAAAASPTATRTRAGSSFVLNLSSTANPLQIPPGLAAPLKNVGEPAPTLSGAGAKPYAYLRRLRMPGLMKLPQLPKLPAQLEQFVRARPAIAAGVVALVVLAAAL